MKRKKKVVIFGLFVIMSSLVAAAFLFFSMPLVWYDQQGRDLVTILESEFDLPIEEGESREAIYHGGFAYLTLKGWKTGSKIFVYGVESKSLQDQLIEHATLVVNDQKMNDVVLEFHPTRVFVTKGALSELVEIEPIRGVRIRAKTR
jgi:hypothetical protein